MVALSHERTGQIMLRTGISRCEFYVNGKRVTEGASPLVVGLVGAIAGYAVARTGTRRRLRQAVEALGRSLQRSSAEAVRFGKAACRAGRVALSVFRETLERQMETPGDSARTVEVVRIPVQTSTDAEE